LTKKSQQPVKHYSVHCALHSEEICQFLLMESLKG